MSKRPNNHPAERQKQCSRMSGIYNMGVSCLLNAKKQVDIEETALFPPGYHVKGSEFA